MNVDTGDRFTKIFVHNNEGKISYTTTISTKDQNGTFKNMYIRIRFKKGEEPSFKEKGNIKIKKGFLSFNEWKEVKYPCIIVTEYEEDENTANVATPKEEAEEFSKEVVITDEDLPF